MLRRYSFYSVVVLALLLVSSGVLAQGQERNRERAQAALDQTEELLLRAREAVQTSGNPQAGQLLQQAVTLQKSARQAFQTDAYLVCMAVTRQAQQKATAAMASARISEQLEGAVLRKLERAGELLDQVRNEVAAGAVADLDVLLETGRESLSRAWEFYRRQEYKPANKLAEQVGRSAQKLLDMARRQDRGESQYDRRRENVRQILEQAREAVTGCDSETAEGFLARAREAFEAAEQRYRDGRPEIALSGLKQAREMAQKAIRECRQTDQLEQRYRRLTAQVEQLSERIQSAPEASREETRRLLGQAREQLARARGLIDRQENEQALAALQAAYLAMERARLYLTVRQ